MIEFMPWYEAGSAMVRCGGDGGCGALLVEGDTELHRRWHERIIEKNDGPLPASVNLNLPQPGPTVLGKQEDVCY